MEEQVCTVIWWSVLVSILALSYSLSVVSISSKCFQVFSYYVIGFCPSLLPTASVSFWWRGILLSTEVFFTWLVLLVHWDGCLEWVMFVTHGWLLDHNQAKDITFSNNRCLSQWSQWTNLVMLRHKCICVWDDVSLQCFWVLPLPVA